MHARCTRVEGRVLIDGDDVYRGAVELGIELDEHCDFIVAALSEIAPEIGLRQSSET